MAALVQTVFAEFTGDNVSSLPKLPAIIPLRNPVFRVAAEHFYKFLDGTSVTSWYDVTTGSNQYMSPAKSQITGATAPKLATRNGNRVVRFNGTTDAIGMPFVTSTPVTFTMVVYLPVTAVSKFLLTTINSESTFAGLGIENTGGFAKYWGDGATVTSTNAMGAGWHIVTVVADGASSRIRLNDTTVTATETGGARPQTMINLGGSTHSTSRTQMDLAELIYWQQAPTSTEISAVHARLKAHYDL
ncbi:hypothetical protein ACT17S_17695 [Glutamicibacter mysorens]